MKITGFFISRWKKYSPVPHSIFWNMKQQIQKRFFLEVSERIKWKEGCYQYTYIDVYENHDETFVTYCSCPALPCQPAAESRPISQGELPGGCGRLTLQFLGNLWWLFRCLGGSGVSHVDKTCRGETGPICASGHLEMWAIQKRQV